MKRHALWIVHSDQKDMRQDSFGLGAPGVRVALGFLASVKLLG